MSSSLKDQEKAVKCYFNEHQQKGDNDQNLMLGVYLSIKTNSLTGRNISGFTVFDLSSPLKTRTVSTISFVLVLFGIFQETNIKIS